MLKVHQAFPGVTSFSALWPGVLWCLILPCAGMEADPLKLFFAVNRLESREDFAFLFETRDEAAEAVGPIITGEIRDIYDLQAPAAKPAMPVPPMASSPSYLLVTPTSGLCWWISSWQVVRLLAALVRCC